MRTATTWRNACHLRLALRRMASVSPQRMPEVMAALHHNRKEVASILRDFRALPLFEMTCAVHGVKP